jgi:hypothetical protein
LWAGIAVFVAHSEQWLAHTFCGYGAGPGCLTS